MKKVKLILENGSEFIGKSFGSEKSIAGEVIFCTAMVGYTESLTDPSYTGQIMVSTYPMLGNYGVPGKSRTDNILDFFESDKIHVSALIVSSYSFQYSHWNAVESLGDWLKANNVPGLYGIDTRALTKILRENGSMLGKIEFEGDEVEFINPSLENLVAQVSIAQSETYGNGDFKVLLVDCGAKNSIIRSLVQRGAIVKRVPWDYDFTNETYDGLLISNGPGNPALCGATVNYLKKALLNEKPIMGIGLGNQLLALAAGAKTYKLKHGHRSPSQPVLLNGTSRCFITSQNHGFAVDNHTIPSNWETMFTNVNDNTNEGIRHKTKPFFSTQFYPDAASGSIDTEFLFDNFIESIKKSKLQ